MGKSLSNSPLTAQKGLGAVSPAISPVSQRFRMPVLFISGSDDWGCPVGPIEEYYDVITAPKKEMNLVDGCGHSPQQQLPDQFAKVIRDFLLECD